MKNSNIRHRLAEVSAKFLFEVPHKNSEINSNSSNENLDKFQADYATLNKDVNKDLANRNVLDIRRKTRLLKGSADETMKFLSKNIPFLYAEWGEKLTKVGKTAQKLDDMEHEYEYDYSNKLIETKEAGIAVLEAKINKLNELSEHIVAKEAWIELKTSLLKINKEKEKGKEPSLNTKTLEEVLERKKEECDLLNKDFNDRVKDLYDYSDDLIATVENMSDTEKKEIEDGNRKKNGHLEDEEDYEEENKEADKIKEDAAKTVEAINKETFKEKEEEAADDDEKKTTGKKTVPNL